MISLLSLYKSLFFGLIFLLIGTVSLTACGKKASRLDPSQQDQDTYTSRYGEPFVDPYPRVYPPR